MACGAHWGAFEICKDDRYACYLCESFLLFSFQPNSLSSHLTIPWDKHLYLLNHIEYSTAALTCQTIITLHIILYFTDSLPLLPTAFSIFSHLIYLQNFSSSWPYISLTSLKFLASCVLVVADHFTWFFHFAQRAQDQKKWKGPKYRYGSASTPKGSGYAAGEETFMDIAAFFAVCVWFVPLFLFLSLSANDNALPSLSMSSFL